MLLAAFILTIVGCIFLWMDMRRTGFTIYPCILCMLLALLLLTLPAVLPGFR